MTRLSLLGDAVCVGCRDRPGPLCPTCVTAVRAATPVLLPGIDRVTAVWAHEGPARGLVLGLKLGARRHQAGTLVSAMTTRILATGTEADAIVWPPCSQADKHRRGFDHAELLARGLAGRLGLPALPVLERAVRSPDQAGLSGPERRTNLVGAFRSSPCPAAVLVVDDVVTTGATILSCASALRSAGAARVEAIVACSAFS